MTTIEIAPEAANTADIAARHAGLTIPAWVATAIHQLATQPTDVHFPMDDSGFDSPVIPQ